MQNLTYHRTQGRGSNLKEPGLDLPADIRVSHGSRRQQLEFIILETGMLEAAILGGSFYHMDTGVGKNYLESSL